MTNIDSKKTEQYELSIRLSADGFSFSVHSPSATEVSSHSFYPVDSSTSLTANIKRMIADVDILKCPYKRTNILIDTPRITPVPFELYEDEQAEELFYHNFPKNNHETVLCNILGKSNIALLFGIDKYAHQLLNEHFPQARIFACISPLTEHFARLSKETPCRSLFVHLRKSTMEIFAFDKGKPLLINTFPCQQTSDRIYYILYIWQQLGFSQEKDELWMNGKDMTNELKTELNKFLRKVNILPSQETLPFDIQTLMICE